METKKEKYEKAVIEVITIKKRKTLCTSIVDIETHGSDMGGDGEEAW